jgi:hypothetical protein
MGKLRKMGNLHILFFAQEGKKLALTFSHQKEIEFKCKVEVVVRRVPHR